MANAKTLTKARRHRGVVSKSIIYVVLSIWALTTIYPFIWVILNSFKKRTLITTDSFSLPIGNKFTWNNYLTAFDRVDIPIAYRNSLVISGSVTILVILFAGLAAYGLSRYNFRGRNVLQMLVVAAMMFPVFATIIPVFNMQAKWGLVDSKHLPLVWLSVILPQTAGNLAFAIIVLSGYIRSLPVELEEAAYIEGYSVFRIFFKIVLPLAKPSFATVAIFSFLWSYNDLFTQMFYLNKPRYFGITRLMGELTSIAGTNYGLMASSVVLVVVPVLIVYIILQKNIVKGLTAGAIKG